MKQHAVMRGSLQVPFRLALALLMQSPQQWDAVSPSALQHTMRSRLSASASTASAAGESTDTGESAVEQEGAAAGSAELLQVAAPGLRLFGLVDFLQRKLKAPTDTASGWQAALSIRCFAQMSTW